MAIQKKTILFVVLFKTNLHKTVYQFAYWFTDELAVIGRFNVSKTGSSSYSTILDSNLMYVNNRCRGFLALMATNKYIWIFHFLTSL